LASAEALHAFDPREVLPNIRVPVLLVAGDRDVWFARESIEQAAQLIPDCTLKVYPDTSHFGAIRSPHFFVDVRAFTGNVSERELAVFAGTFELDEAVHIKRGLE